MVWVRSGDSTMAAATSAKVAPTWSHSARRPKRLRLRVVESVARGAITSQRARTRCPSPAILHRRKHGSGNGDQQPCQLEDALVVQVRLSSGAGGPGASEGGGLGWGRRAHRLLRLQRFGVAANRRMWLTAPPRATPSGAGRSPRAGQRSLTRFMLSDAPRPGRSRSPGWTSVERLLAGEGLAQRLVEAGDREVSEAVDMGLVVGLRPPEEVPSRRLWGQMCSTWVVRGLAKADHSYDSSLERRAPAPTRRRSSGSPAPGETGRSHRPAGSGGTSRPERTPGPAADAGDDLQATSGRRCAGAL